MSDKIRKEFDTRVVRFHLRAGNVSQDEHQAYLDSLPDDAAAAVQSDVRFDNAWERRNASESGRASD